MKIDSRYFRPTETEFFQADAAKASERLGWQAKVTFKELVRIMVDADMEAIGLKSPGHGRAVLTNHGLNSDDRALLHSTLGRNVELASQ